MSDVFQPGRAQAIALDAKDPLASFRSRFYVREGELYMDGNSLGICSVDAERAVLHMLQVWKEEGIRLWNVEDGRYFLYPQRLGARMAKLIGADANEVTVTNSTTINLHQCIATFYHPDKKRYKILIDELNFPTDRYAVESQLRLHGQNPTEALVVVKSRDGRTIAEEDIIAAMGEDVQMALLPSVLYRSAQLLDLRRITAAARERGVWIGWDLCHSIGAVAHNFKEIEPDFAVWCTYKYLSAGPGSIAGLYVNRRHFGTPPGLAGWHGNVKETQFQLRPQHAHAHDADGYLTGTGPLLSMSALEGTLAVFEAAGMARVREKSLQLNAYLMYLIDTRLAQYGCVVGTPREDARRGGHVALEHPEAYRISAVLRTRGVVPDFREPNVVRLAPVALYTSYTDVYNVVEILADILEHKAYETFRNERGLVV